MSGSDKSESAGGRVVVWLLVGLVVLFGGAYVAAGVVAGDKVPLGTKVAGIDIGGKDPVAASHTLSAKFGTKLDQPVSLAIVDHGKQRVIPSEWGFSVNSAATVDAAGATGGWSPGRLWEYYSGGSAVQPVLEIDATAFDKALNTLNNKVGKAAVDGTVGFKNGAVVTTAGEPGHGVDAVVAERAIRRAVLEGESGEIALTDVSPVIDDAAVQKARQSLADPAASGPVTVDFGKASVTLAPEKFLPALSMREQDGALVLRLDDKVLAGAIDSSTDYRGAPKDATVRIVDGKPKVIPAKPGEGFDPAALHDVFLAAVTSKGDRTATTPSTTVDATFTTADAKKLGIKQKVSGFTTQYPYAEYRNINIGRAAELVNGTLLKPGETFSLNDTVGERTRENGFTEGFMIADGVFKQDLGGGVSQMATTTFNAMFFAGLQDVEHKPHSFYIDRYPVGREATVAWGSVDLRFKNDTKYGILVQSFINPASPGGTGSVTVNMWSTKVWDITTSTGDRYNFTSPNTRTLSGPGCVANSGYGGFEIDVKRYFHHVGSSKVAKTQNFHTVYTPSDTVICKPVGSEKEKKD